MEDSGRLIPIVLLERPIMSDAIAAKVNEAIAAEFELDVASLTPEARLIEDVGLDSLDSVDLIATLERTFKVKCPEAEARKMRTVGDIHRFVATLVQAPTGVRQAA